MVDKTHQRYVAADRSYYAIIKKEIHAYALAMNFDKKRIAELDLIVAELTSNLNKYAKDGELLVGYFEHDGYLEIICTDNGPGMTDIHRMMSDGYSSTNTLGHGLGSIKRLSDYFELYTLKDWGSIILCRVYKKTQLVGTNKAHIAIRPVVIAKPSEEISGDGYYAITNEHCTKLIIADGLGHGPDANQAVNAAINAFKTFSSHSPVAILRHVHSEIRKTRGVVSSVAMIDHTKRHLTIAGVGNIMVRLVGHGNISKSHLSYNGIIGHNIPTTMNDQVIDLVPYEAIVFCSDGIQSRWDLSKHAGILKCDASILAAAVYKEFGRNTDDMSVVVAKIV